MQRQHGCWGLLADSLAPVRHAVLTGGEGVEQTGSLTCPSGLHISTRLHIHTDTYTKALCASTATNGRERVKKGNCKP